MFFLSDRKKIEREVTPYDFMELTPLKQKCSVGIGNTHAQNTFSPKHSKEVPEISKYKGYDLRALIDWFDCTFDTDFYNLDFVLTLLFKYFDLPFFSPLVEKEEKETIWQFNIKQEKGYGKSISFGDIAIFYDDYGNIDKGIKLSLSGNGCREAELLFRNDYTWFDFLKEIYSFHVNITRIDLAIDDFHGYFDIGHLIEIANEGYMVSKFKVYEPRGKRLTVDGSSLGHSLYLGSPKSRLFIRFYEKGKEQKDFNGIWNRTELQLRNERAAFAVDEIIKDRGKHLGEYAMGILNNYVRFCDKDKVWSVNKTTGELKKDRNRSRWKCYDWWLDFLHGVEKIKLSEELPKSNIETKKRWVFDKVSKSLAMLALADNDNNYKTQLFKNIMYNGIGKINEKDLKLIEKYREDKKRAANKYKQPDDNIIDFDV